MLENINRLAEKHDQECDAVGSHWKLHTKSAAAIRALVEEVQAWREKDFKECGDRCVIVTPERARVTVAGTKVNALNDGLEV